MPRSGGVPGWPEESEKSVFLTTFKLIRYGAIDQAELSNNIGTSAKNTPAN